MRRHLLNRPVAGHLCRRAASSLLLVPSAERAPNLLGVPHTGPGRHHLVVAVEDAGAPAVAVAALDHEAAAGDVADAPLRLPGNGRHCTAFGIGGEAHL